MNISFAFKNFEPSDHLKKYARRRFEKLGRFFGKAAGLDVQVVLSIEKFRQKCEVAITGEGLQLAANEQNDDMYAAIDLVLDKLEAQIKKHVSRAKDHRRQGRAPVQVDVFTYNMDDVENISPIKGGTERFEPKPMSVDEAAMQMESIGSDFLVFLNAENYRINVIYQRRVGGYGLIDPIV